MTNNRTGLYAIMGVIVLMYIPFINKPVHIDDTSFIGMSKAVGFISGDGPAGEGYFLGVKSGSVSAISTTHLFIPYILKLIRTLTGSGSEFAYHIPYLLFPVILAFALKGICSELVLPLFPALLLVMGNIAYLPVSHNLMADAPTFSLWVMSFYLFLKGQRKGNNLSMALSSLILTMAAGLSNQSIFLIVVFLIYLIIFHRDKKIWIIFFLTPLVLFSGVFLYLNFKGLLSVSEIITHMKIGYRGEGFYGKKVLGILIDTGIIALFLNPLFFVKRTDGTPKNLVKYLLPVSVLIALISVYYIEYPVIERLWLFTLILSGAFFILNISFILFTKEFVSKAPSPSPSFSGGEGCNLSPPLRGGDEGEGDVNGFTNDRISNGDKDRKIIILLLLWFYAVLLYNLFLMPFISLRYVLPILLPSIIAVMIFLGRVRFLHTAAIFTLILGLAVAYGDYVFASSYRNLPKEIKIQVGHNTEERIWFIGDWGMQYYMLKAGYRYLTAEGNEPKKGDLIFISSVQRIWEPSFKLRQRIRLVDEVAFESWFPIRVMGLDIRTGYYSHLWGYLPFTISTKPVERFGVFRVVRD